METTVLEYRTPVSRRALSVRNRAPSPADGGFDECISDESDESLRSSNPVAFRYALEDEEEAEGGIGGEVEEHEEEEASSSADDGDDVEAEEGKKMLMSVRA